MRETAPLKSLASSVLTRLERNKPWNKRETGGEKNVLRVVSSETTNNVIKEPFLIRDSSLLEDYEERLAIAEYDGHQGPVQAQRIAYQDVFIAVLLSLPDEASSTETSLKEWLRNRIEGAQSWIEGMEIGFPSGNA
jgi:hypothetical protein